MMNADGSNNHALTDTIWEDSKLTAQHEIKILANIAVMESKLFFQKQMGMKFGRD